jgi:CRISPR-associated protein Csx14
MSIPEASIRVNVDPTNPGQFFACCGLLELADRLWPGAEGWFADDGREFRIACDGMLPGILSALTKEVPIALSRLESGLQVPPIIAPLVVRLSSEASISLDSWMRVGL